MALHYDIDEWKETSGGNHWNKCDGIFLLIFKYKYNDGHWVYKVKVEDIWGKDEHLSFEEAENEIEKIYNKNY